MPQHTRPIFEQRNYFSSGFEIHAWPGTWSFQHLLLNLALHVMLGPGLDDEEEEEEEEEVMGVDGS